MKSSEIDQFEEAFGYEPTQIRVAIDALAVYVNKDNPLEKLSLEEVDAMFSSTRKCGRDQPIDDWGTLGLDGRWSGKPISLYGRNSASGTYGYFKTIALCKGDYRPTVKEQPGSASVVQGVTEDLYGIGYSGMGYQTSGVKALALAKEAGGEYYTTEVENVVNGRYPLSRFLYVYINKAPGKPLDPLVREFLRFVLSADGQSTVIKDGYIPISAKLVERELAKLD
jgi:phosphate transport system substrate-binding protein